jgi:Mce-associated membrane protein
MRSLTDIIRRAPSDAEEEAAPPEKEPVEETADAAADGDTHANADGNADAAADGDIDTDTHADTNAAGDADAAGDANAGEDGAEADPPLGVREPDADDGADEAVSAGRRVPGRRVLVVLGILTVLFGGSAAWFGSQADRVRDESGVRNGALTDVAGTSDVKGVVTDAVNTIFSFDYADMARTEQAADQLLTGGAVRQYDALIAQVRAQASRQKLVLTTTVTDSAVEMLQGNRARLLLFADQRSTRTTTKTTSYAAAMLAVDAVRQGGHWKISGIDTLSG